MRLSRELAELDPVAEKARALADAERELAEAEALIADPATDREMRALAEDERQRAARADRRRCAASCACCSCRATRPTTAAPSSRSAPAPAATRRRSSPATSSACTSATPALHGWKVELLSASEGEVGGYREIIAAVRGAGVYARLKFESGVHRVQRVPATEASGRIHTSAATVAVLPEAEEVDIEIKPEDIRIDTTRASSAGGQHANTTEIGGAHPAHPDRHHRHGEREVAAPEPRARACRCCARGSTTWSAQKQDERARRRRARARSARATARSASAPTIFRRGG